MRPKRHLVYEVEPLALDLWWCRAVRRWVKLEDRAFHSVGNRAYANTARHAFWIANRCPGGARVGRLRGTIDHGYESKAWEVGRG